MYAIVEQGGFQFRITPGAEIEVPRIDAEVGDKVTISRVLLLEDASGARVLPFTAAEGADLHCEPLARTLVHERVFDALADLLLVD